MIDKNTYPKISIITPSYNQGEFIERTIQSILGQQYPNLEYMIIDGGSTDNTIEIIRKYENEIDFWISEKDKGTYEANNKALEKITGDYWCVINSDDVLLPGALEKIASCIQSNPNEEWIVGNVKLIDSVDKTIVDYRPEAPSYIDKYSFLTRCWILHPGVFIHKNVLTQIGLFKKYHSMDYEYWLRMEHKGYKPFLLNELVAGLRMHDDCKSADTVRALEECLKVIQDFIAENNLSKLQGLDEVLMSHKIEIKKCHIVKSISERNKIKLKGILKEIPRIQLSAIYTRWYLGGLKFYWFGKSKTVNLDTNIKVSKANWND